MVVFGQKWLYSGKSCCILAKWLYLGKVVVFEQKWLYSGKKWLYSVKSGYIRTKVVVFGQCGCN